MTNQEIFDKVLAHLRQQGEAAKSGGNCAYRSSNGNMCAIGCLMPDEVYRPEYEGAEVTILPHDVLLACGIDPYDGEQMRLCDFLQDAHDHELYYYGLSEWERRMWIIADDFGLQYTGA